MIRESIAALGNESREALRAKALTKGSVPAGEYVTSVSGLIIFSRVINCERLQIGAVGKEHTGIRRAEGMNRQRRNGEAQICKPRGGDVDLCNRQYEMIYVVRTQWKGPSSGGGIVWHQKSTRKTARQTVRRRIGVISWPGIDCITLSVGIIVDL